MIRSIGRGRLAPPSLEHIATICGLLIAVATIPLALAGQRHAALARAAAWTIAAPPCPIVSRQAYLAFGAPTLDVFDFAGTRFARAYGYANCGEIAIDRLFGLDLAPVCQFNNPTVLEVTTPRGRVFFMTGIKPATILLAHGEPRCVLGAKRGLDWLRN